MSLANILLKEDISTLIFNLIKHANDSGGLLNRYDEEFFLSYFDHKKIIEAELMLHDKEKELTVEEFLRFLLNLIHHTQE